MRNIRAIPQPRGPTLMHAEHCLQVVMHQNGSRLGYGEVVPSDTLSVPCTKATQMASTLWLPTDVVLGEVAGLCFVVAGRFKHDHDDIIEGAAFIPNASEYWQGAGKILVVLITSMPDIYVPTCGTAAADTTATTQVSHMAAQHGVDEKHASARCAVLHVDISYYEDQTPEVCKLLPGLRRLAAFHVCHSLMSNTTEPLFPKMQFVMCEDDNIGMRAGQHATSSLLSDLVNSEDPMVLARAEFNGYNRSCTFEDANDAFHSGKSIALNKAALRELAKSNDQDLLRLVPAHPNLIWEDAWLLGMLRDRFVIPVVEAGLFRRDTFDKNSALHSMTGKCNTRKNTGDTRSCEAAHAYDSEEEEEDDDLPEKV